ncbi:MAG: ATP/GTP-binding protein [Anaerolineales bacterium]
MERTLKLVVTGPYGAGKSQFVETLSDIEVVRTERRVSAGAADGKRETTVAMDYGRVALDDAILHLNGTPGQARFDFMWDILTREMHGFVVLVDSCQPDTFADARELIEAFSRQQPVPYVVAANKQDLACAPSLDQMRREMKVASNVLVMPCVATRRTSVRQVVKQLVSMIA